MMEPGFFPRAAAAAAHLSNSKTTKLPEFSLSSPLPIWDLHTCQALSTSSLPVPASGFTTTETAASSTDTSNYHESSVYKLPCLVHPVASTLQDPYEPEEYHFGLVSPASFSELMIRAMEISEASSNRLMLASSLPDPIIPTVTAQHSASTEGISAYLLASKLSAHVQADVLGATPNMPGSPNSPSKQDSSVMSTPEDSDADHKHQISNSMKRRNCGLRKAQPKKVVSIPFTESKQKGEAPLCSDTWAWRKYGQKPIKGSPFPRGYYRCSSSKGCPARKQVERSRSDPTMVIVTYTADHNHQLPANRSSNSSKAGPTKGQGVEDTSSYQKAENLFSCIINSPNAVDEQVVSSMDLLQEEEESFFLQRDVDLCLSRTSTSESDGVFDNLEELPELSAIFSKGYGEGQFDDEGNCEQPEFL